MRESDIQKEIVSTLRRLPRVLVTRHNPTQIVGNGKFVRVAGGRGAGDIIGCAAGRYFEIEVKRPGGKQSDAQIERADSVKRCGGVYICTSVAQDAVAAVLDLITTSYKTE
jgi:hypothetical protein